MANINEKPVVWSNYTWVQRLTIFAALGFGSGLLPKTPGTWGSLVIIALAPWIVQMDLWVFWICMMALIVSGIGICHVAAQLLDVHDDSRIVWDEFAGQFIAMFPIIWMLNQSMVQWSNVGLTLWVVAAFLLFRFFDVLKPWPIRYFDQHVGGGFGIMLDDVIAGVFAACVLLLGIFVVGLNGV